MLETNILANAQNKVTEKSNVIQLKSHYHRNKNKRGSARYL